MKSSSSREIIPIFHSFDTMEICHIKITIESSLALNNPLTIYNYILYLFLFPIQNVEKLVLKLHFLEYCFQLTITLDHIVARMLFLRFKLTFPLFDVDILLDNYHI